MNLEDLKNPELQEKLKSANSFEELLALVREEGYELSDEQIEGMSGGSAKWINCHDALVDCTDLE